MSAAEQILDLLVEAIADRVAAKLRGESTAAQGPDAPADSAKSRGRRRVARAPAQPDREVTDLDRARAKKMLAGMGIR